MFGEFNNLANNGMPPLSMIDCVCWVVPEATLVKAQALSSYFKEVR